MSKDREIARLNAEIAELKQRCATCKTLANAELDRRRHERGKAARAERVEHKRIMERPRCRVCGRQGICAHEAIRG